MCIVLSQNKFNIHDQLTKYFKFEVKLLTTPCIVSETEKLGTFSATVNGAMQIVKQYAVHMCAHAKKPINGSKCLLSMIGKENSSRYDGSYSAASFDVYVHLKNMLLVTRF